MSHSVRALLDSFDALSDTDRIEAAAEILRRVTPAGSEMTEQALVEVADNLFILLDAEEGNAVNADSQAG